MSQVYAVASFSKTHDRFGGNNNKVGKRHYSAEVLVYIMQSFVEHIWVCVSIHVEITPKAIDQAFVIRVVKPDAAIRPTSPISEVHKIVPRGADYATSEVCQLAPVICAWLRLKSLHHLSELIGYLVVLTTRQAKRLARGTNGTRHHLLQAEMR